MTRRLGRLPRKFHPAIPHWSALRMVGGLKPIPAAVNNTVRLPPRLGDYYNDVWGDCTCAAFYHAKQVWSVASGKPIDTQPADNALRLYEAACGFNPSAPLVNGQNPTDNGGCEQDVLSYLLNTGAPVGDSGTQREKIVAFIEVDPTKEEDVNRAIYECGLVYIGIDVPAYLEAHFEPGSVWDTNPTGDTRSLGGHALICASYDATTGRRGGISWGSAGYSLTRLFWRTYVQECYAIVDAEWLTATGRTVCGLTLEETAAQMAAFRLAA